MSVGHESSFQNDEPETESSSRRSMDPEIRLIGSMIRDIEELEPDARARVMSYLSSRYASTP